MVYFRWQLFTLIHLCQSVAELLLFVQKSKMAAVAILNYNFVMLDHPQSPFVHVKFPSKFHVHWMCTFLRYCDSKISQIWLKMPIQAHKNHVLGSFDPQTWGDEGKGAKKGKNPKVAENALRVQTPFPSFPVNQILHVESYPGYLSWFQVSLRSVEKLAAVGGRNFGLPIDLAHRLYNSLLLLRKPWLLLLLCCCGPGICSAEARLVSDGQGCGAGWGRGTTDHWWLWR